MERVNEEAFSAILKQKRSELSIPLLRCEQDEQRVENLLAATAICRQTPLDGISIVMYASEIGRLDGEKYELADVEWALHSIAAEKRGEYETPFPSLGELLERIEQQRRKRTKAEADEQCNARLESYRQHADRLRQERENEWNRKKAEKITKAS